MTGMHRSPYFGFSVEFAQHRQYTPGDDIRHLDWKVFGRTDKLYLKQYQKETNLDLVLLLDCSGSMSYGSDLAGKSWRKFDLAGTLAAALSYLALKQQDRVALMLFDDQVRATTSASNSRGHWRSIVETIASASTQLQDRVRSEQAHSTDLARLFDQIAAKLTQRSLIVLISDLFDQPESYERGLARLHHRRHDVMVLQTLDRAELTFPFRSPSEFVGMEAEGRLRLDPASLRKAYLDALRQHLRQLELITRRFGFEHLLLDSAASLGPPLSHFLARRAAAATHGRG